METLQFKPLLLTLVLTASMAACSAGNSTPAIPASSSSALARPQTMLRLASASSAFVDLRNASTYAIIAGSTVTNTGPTSITGDVAIFPGTAITGFLPGVIHGDLHAADPTAQQAKLDLGTAYRDAMGRVGSPVLVAGNLGGQTLAPGLYKSTSSLEVSSGDLTLDGGGDANAVYVFQMASTFNMTTGRRVILTNGARAANIFWAVGSSATLGTGCSFYGNLLVYASISMATGTVMEGRALTQVGAVTMQSNTIVLPAP